jgi:glycogen synthase
MTPPPVSIVINTYNRARSLRQTLESLRQLDYPNFEVVVVNGPSDDDTDLLLSEYADWVKAGFCEHRNLSESRNIGIRLAAGDLVAFIDDDAYPDPAWLDVLVEGFDTDEIAAVGGPVYDHTGGRFQAKYSLATKLGDARVAEGPNPTPYLNAPYTEEFLYPIGTNALFRYDLLTRLGGYDEEFEYYLDETDLCCRLIDRGFVIRALEEGFVYHKFLASDVRAPNRAIRNRFTVLKNRCYFALKHGLQTHSFYDVCRNVVEAVERSRGDYRWCIENGLLTEDDFLQFEQDVHRAFDVALAAFQRGGERTRPPDWFSIGKPSFKLFPTLRPRDRKLHICLFSQEYPPGPVNGIARFVHTLAGGLADQGHLVRVLTTGEHHDRVDLEDGVWVHRVAITEHDQPEQFEVPSHLWNYSASLLDEVRRMSRHRAVDVVQAPNWDLEGIAVLLDGSFPTVVSLHTPLATVKHVDPYLVERNPDLERMIELDRFCTERADAVLANGASVIDAIAAFGARLEPGRVEIIPHGLRDRRRHALVDPMDKGGPRLLFVGRLEKRKGIDTLLAAVPLLIEEFPDLAITIVGNDTIPDDDGSTYRAAFERSASRSVAARVRFAGFVGESELDELYARCDVFVAPSRFESFGLVLVEAMMFGKPIVAGDNSGMRAVMEDGKNGYLVPPDNAEALRRAVSKLLTSSERRRAFGERSRQLYEERFSLEGMVDQTVRFYNALTERLPNTRSPLMDVV